MTSWQGTGQPLTFFHSVPLARQKVLMPNKIMKGDFQRKKTSRGVVSIQTEYHYCHCSYSLVGLTYLTVMSSPAPPTRGSLDTRPLLPGGRIFRPVTETKNVKFHC